MAFVSHPACDVPDDDAIIWRYMGFSKLAWILQTEQLHFHRADQFSDPFEGSIPASVKDSGVHRKTNITGTDDEWDEFQTAVLRQSRQFTFLNCWHLNTKESAAMWDLYGGDGGNAVAIKTTTGRMKKALQRAERPVHLGHVTYLDYFDLNWKEMEDGIPEAWFFNSLSWFLTKRRSFQHENEVRAIVSEMPMLDGPFDSIVYRNVPFENDRPVVVKVDKGERIGEFDCVEEPVTGGHDVTVDLDGLIDRIYVAPQADDWFYWTVRRVVADSDTVALGEDDVVRSNLDNDPIF